MPGSKSPDEVAYNMETKPFGEVAGCIKEKKNETIGSRSAHVVNFSGPMPALSWPQSDKLMSNLQPPYSQRFLYPVCTREAEDSGKSLEFASQCYCISGNSQTSHLGNLGEQGQLQGAQNGETTQNMELNVSSVGGESMQHSPHGSKVQEIWTQFLVENDRGVEETWKQILNENGGEAEIFLRNLNKNGVVDAVTWRKFLDHFDREDEIWREIFSNGWFAELFNKYDRFRQSEHCDPVIDGLLSSV